MVRVSDFQVGKVYRMVLKPWDTPLGPGGDAEVIVRRILDPADDSNTAFIDGHAPQHVIESWRWFLRVQDIHGGSAHFLAPCTIDSATLVEPDTDE